MKILYYFENIIFSSEDDISKMLFQIPSNNSYEYQKESVLRSIRVSRTELKNSLNPDN